MKKIILLLLLLLALLIACSPKQNVCTNSCEQPQKIGTYNITIESMQEKYYPGEKISLLIKNNEKNTNLVIAGNPCLGDYYSVKDSKGNILQLEGVYRIELCYPEVLETIKPNEEKNITTWDQKYYDSDTDKFLQLPRGQYVLILNKVLVESINLEFEALYDNKIEINITLEKNIV